jgi:lysophospholipase L1-like esterase
MSSCLPRPIFGGFLAALLLVAQPSAALIRYIAFGDSISYGIGDPEEKGYPSRLRRILEKSQSEDVQIVKSAVPGEETSAALSRIDAALSNGGDALLLMEGTNDVSRIFDGSLSMESVIANLNALALAAKRRDIEPIHATIFPRSPRSTRDRDTSITAALAREIRELAYSKKRRLVDVYEAFDPGVLEDVFDLYYFDGFDPIGHPNEEGYKRIAQTFADVLLELDTIPPVVGPFFPGTLPSEVPPDTEFRVAIYEPVGASGINQKESTLLINGRPVGETEGNRRRLQLVFQDEETIGCRVVLAVRTEDRSTPPNATERVLELYNVTGRTVLVGDVDFDCRVDGFDLVSLARGFGTETGDERYQRRLDLNTDGFIDGEDLALLAKNFSRSSI